MTLLWLSLFILVLALVVVDLFVLRPRGTAAGIERSIRQGVLYLALGAAFTVPVFFIYDRQVFQAGAAFGYQEALGGHEATLQYLACFFVEMLLSLDIAFVVAALFAHFRISDEQRHRLLFWGLLVALVVRGGVILTLGGLIHSFEWFRFVLVAFLLVAAIRMIVIRRENLDPSRNWAVRIARRVLPMRESSADGELLQLRKGLPAMTPLLVPLLMYETADVFLALDSLPASFVFTREPFLIFAASAFSLLVVRSLVPALVAVMHRLRYFKIGLSMILAYSAVVIALPTAIVIENFGGASWKLTTVQKLLFVTIAAGIGLAAARILGTPQTEPRVAEGTEVSPLGPEADRLAREALTRIRKIFVFVIGVTGLVAGGIMAIGPGPGIPILFIALLLLASEFVWARVLVNKYRVKAERVAERAAEEARKRFSPLALVGLIVAELGVAWLIHMHGHVVLNWAWTLVFEDPLLKGRIPLGIVIGAFVPFVAGQVFLGYLAYGRKRTESAT